MHSAFSDVIGHELQLRYLSQVLERGSWAHAYVFSGPRAVGKTAVAERFAAALLSTSVKGLALHPDFSRLSRPLEETEGGRKRDIPTEEVKELCGRLQLAAVHGTKVVIIDDADGMNVFGQNALLKTLEEPSGRAVVILVTEDVDALLPTIRSRAVPLAFPRVSTPILEKALMDRGASEFVSRESAVRALGRPGIGLMLTGEGKLDALREEEAKIRAFLAAPLYDRMTRAGAVGKAGGQTEREAWLEDLAFALTKDLAHDPRGTARALSALLDTHERIRQNVNTTLALEHIALSL